MSITPESKKRFRSIGHKLKPVVTIAGNGLSENVLAETQRALNDHELIKIKLAILDREDRSAITNELCKTCSATLIQSIGKMILIFREAKKPNIQKSNIR